MFNISQLMAGAMVTLGILLEISLKVLPLPAAELTPCLELNPADAIKKMTALASQSLPLSALSYAGRMVYIRVSGAEKAVTVSLK